MKRIGSKKIDELIKEEQRLRRIVTLKIMAEAAAQAQLEACEKVIEATLLAFEGKSPSNENINWEMLYRMRKACEKEAREKMRKIFEEIEYKTPSVGYEEIESKRDVCGCCRTNYVLTHNNIQALKAKYLGGDNG